MNMVNKDIDVNSFVSVAQLDGDESILAGLEGDNEWRNSWARLIGYAWMSPAHFVEAVVTPLDKLRELSNYTKPPGLILRIQAAVSNDVQNAFKTWLENADENEFKNKYNMDSKSYEKWKNKVLADNPEEREFITPINQKPTAKPNRKPKSDYAYNYDAHKEQKNGWEDLTSYLPTVVIMTMPPRPAEFDTNGKGAVNVSAFALADYESTVKTQPFTC